MECARSLAAGEPEALGDSLTDDRRCVALGGAEDAVAWRYRTTYVVLVGVPATCRFSTGVEMLDGKPVRRTPRFEERPGFEVVDLMIDEETRTLQVGEMPFGFCFEEKVGDYNPLLGDMKLYYWNHLGFLNGRYEELAPTKYGEVPLGAVYGNPNPMGVGRLDLTEWPPIFTPPGE